MPATPDDPAPRGLDRRAFLALMGAAGLASALPDATAAAPAGAPAAPAAADSSAHAAPALSAAETPSADALALAGVLERRYPDRLTAAQWQSVTGSIDARLDSGRRLREHKLANGDEPDFAFRP